MIYSQWIGEGGIIELESPWPSIVGDYYGRFAPERAGNGKPYGIEYEIADKESWLMTLWGKSKAKSVTSNVSRVIAEAQSLCEQAHARAPGVAIWLFTDLPLGMNQYGAEAHATENSRLRPMFAKADVVNGHLYLSGDPADIKNTTARSAYDYASRRIDATKLLGGRVVMDIMPRFVYGPNMPAEVITALLQACQDKQVDSSFWCDGLTQDSGAAMIELCKKAVVGVHK